MKSDIFTRLLQKHNLSKKLLGYDCYVDLGALIKEPSPLRKGKGKRPCSLKCGSLLIAAGFAKLNVEAAHYEATPAGVMWHGRVTQILPKQPA